MLTIKFEKLKKQNSQKRRKQKQKTLQSANFVDVKTAQIEGLTLVSAELVENKCNTNKNKI
tara:strand:+ start:201 stop:383 length:183 start_codon:yes stop_codon:yes gene_type:complete